MFATIDIPKDSFVCEYKGTLLSANEGREREKEYESQNLGNFLYFFEWKMRKYWLVLCNFFDIGYWCHFLVNCSNSK